MNKTILLILLISALLPLCFDVAKVYAAMDKPVMVTASYKPNDMRSQALYNVLSKYNSPLRNYSNEYIEAADRYEVDWKLLPAIGGLESSFGKHQMPGSHNSYGWGGGHIYFTSVEDGMDKVLYGLKTRYMSRGATTVETIAPIYSESPTWAPRVRKFMAQFEAEYNRLQNQTLALSI